MCALWNIHEIHNAQQKENENLTPRNNNCKLWTTELSYLKALARQEKHTDSEGDSKHKIWTDTG